MTEEPHRNTDSSIEVRTPTGTAQARRQRSSSALLLGPSLLLVGGLFLLPTGALLARSITEPPGGFAHYASFLSSRGLLTILARSAWVAIVVTAISLVIGYTVAYVAATSSKRMRTLILASVAASLFISVVVRGYSWLTILDRQGVLNSSLAAIGLEHWQTTLVHNFAGVVIGMIQYGIPFMVLSIYDVMRRFDERLRYAAATLGARPAIVFLKVYLPLTMPGVAAGCTIVFIATLGYYVLPSILGGAGEVMIGELIADKIQTTLEWGEGAAIAVVLLVIALGFFAVLYRLSTRLQPGTDGG